MGESNRRKSTRNCPTQVDRTKLFTTSDPKGLPALSLPANLSSALSLVY